MEALKNYYSILGVGVSATQEEIAAAYNVAMQLRPKGGDAPEAYKKFAEEVQTAYAVLRNEELRSMYDESLAEAAKDQREYEEYTAGKRNKWRDDVLDIIIAKEHDSVAAEDALNAALLVYDEFNLAQGLLNIGVEPSTETLCGAAAKLDVEWMETLVAATDERSPAVLNAAIEHRRLEIAEVLLSQGFAPSEETAKLIESMKHKGGHNADFAKAFNKISTAQKPSGIRSLFRGPKPAP